jgi:hypothetical protein
MRSRILFTLSIVAIGLAGCSSGGGLFGGTAASGMGAARCTAANAKEFLGQELEGHTVDQARAHAGALRSRVIKPGDPVSAEVDPLRLNVELAPNGRIQRLRCG